MEIWDLWGGCCGNSLDYGDRNRRIQNCLILLIPCLQSDLSRHWLKRYDSQARIPNRQYSRKMQIVPWQQDLASAYSLQQDQGTSDKSTIHPSLYCTEKVESPWNRVDSSCNGIRCICDAVQSRIHYYLGRHHLPDMKRLGGRATWRSWLLPSPGSPQIRMWMSPRVGMQFLLPVFFWTPPNRLSRMPAFISSWP